MSQIAPPRPAAVGERGGQRRPAPRWWEWSRFGLGLVAFAATASMVVAWAWTIVVPLVSDKFAVVVISGSMSPNIKKGDVALIQPSDGKGLGPPSVILFKTPGLDRFHRIVYVNPDGTYVTKGDANNEPDAEPVRPEDVKGVGRLLVPFAAIGLIWVREGRWLLAGLYVLAATLVICACPWGLSDRYDPWVLAEARRERRPAPEPRLLETLPPASVSRET